MRMLERGEGQGRAEEDRDLRMRRDAHFYAYCQASRFCDGASILNFPAE